MFGAICLVVVGNYLIALVISCTCASYICLIKAESNMFFAMFSWFLWNTALAILITMGGVICHDILVKLETGNHLFTPRKFKLNILHVFQGNFIVLEAVFLACLILSDNLDKNWPLAATPCIFSVDIVRTAKTHVDVLFLIFLPLHVIFSPYLLILTPPFGVLNTFSTPQSLCYITSLRSESASGMGMHKLAVAYQRIYVNPTLTLKVINGSIPEE